MIKWILEPRSCKRIIGGIINQENLDGRKNSWIGKEVETNKNAYRKAELRASLKLLLSSGAEN